MELKSVTTEEIAELAQSLSKFKDEPEDAIKILKILQNTQVTAQHLKDKAIGIGKALTSVKESHPDNKELSE